MSVFLFNPSRYPSSAAAAATAASAAVAENLDSSAAGGSSTTKQEKRINPKIDFQLFKTYALLRSDRREDEAQTIFDRLISKTDPESMQGFLKLIPSELLEKSPKINEAAAGGATLSAKQQSDLRKKAEKVANQLLKLACESPQFFTYTPYVLDQEKMVIRDITTQMRASYNIDNNPFELSIRVSANRRFTVVSNVSPSKLQIEIRHDDQHGDHIVARINPGKPDEIIQQILPQDEETFLFFIPSLSHEINRVILGYKGIKNSPTMPLAQVSYDGRLIPIHITGEGIPTPSLSPCYKRLCTDSSPDRQVPYYESCFPEISALEALKFFDSTQLYRTKEENSLFCFINLKDSFSKHTVAVFLTRVFGGGNVFAREIPLCDAFHEFRDIPKDITNWKFAVYSPDGRRFFVIDTFTTTVDEKENTVIQIPLHFSVHRWGIWAGRYIDDGYASDKYASEKDSDDEEEPAQPIISKKIVLNSTTAQYLENDQVVRTFCAVERQTIPQFYLDWVDGKKYMLHQARSSGRISLADVRREDLGAPHLIAEALNTHNEHNIVPLPIANLIFQYSQEGLPFMTKHRFSEYVKAPIARVAANLMSDVSPASAAAAAAPAPAATAGAMRASAMPARTTETPAAAAAAAAIDPIETETLHRRAPKRRFPEISRSSNDSGSSSSDGSGSSSSLAPKRTKYEQ